MPGPWTALPNQTADGEELSFNLDGLTAATDYEAEFSTSATFEAAKTTAAAFRTLDSVDRTLSAVTVNGVDLAGWNFTTEDTFSAETNFAAFSGTVTVTAAASHAAAQVTVTPAVSANQRNGDTITITIEVAVGGGTRTYTLTVNVVAYTLGNFSAGHCVALEWAPEVSRFFAVTWAANPPYTTGPITLRAYDDRGNEVHSRRLGNRVNSSCCLCWDGAHIRVASQRFTGGGYAWGLARYTYGADAGFAAAGGQSFSPPGASQYNEIGIWSMVFDGTRYWIVRGRNMRAYTLSGLDLVRDAVEDWLLDADNTSAGGATWGDSRFWIPDAGDGDQKFYVYGANRVRDAGREFPLHSANSGTWDAAYGVLHGSAQIWAADFSDRLCYAYRASDGDYLGASS